MQKVLEKQESVENDRTRGDDFYYMIKSLYLKEPVTLIAFNSS